MLVTTSKGNNDEKNSKRMIKRAENLRRCALIAETQSN